MNTKRFYSFLAIIAILCMLAIPFQPAQATGATIYVPDNYPTIQGALNAANSGDTIYVRAGTYYEHLVVSKSLTLQGEDKTTTIIDGGGSGYGIHMPSTDNVTISGFTVRNAYYGIFFTSGATYNTVSNVITTGSFHGINNHDQGNHHNTFQSVEVHGNSDSGFSAYAGSNYVKVLDSNVHDNGGSGIQIGWSSNWSVSGTRITNNSYGLVVDTAKYGTAIDNHIANNTFDGVHFAGWGPLNNNIRGNRIQGNGRAALYFQCSARSNTSIENEISGNAYGVWITRNDACPNYGNFFYHNTFSNNAVNAQDDEDRYGGNTWDNGYPFGGNSWDTYEGFDLFSGSAQDLPGADGIGDTPYVILAGLDVDRYPMMQPDANPSSCPSDMISYWKGDGSAIDALGFNHGQAQGDVHYIPGKIGQAFSFDGNGDYITFSQNAGISGNNPFSMELWVKAPTHVPGYDILASVGSRSVFSPEIYFSLSGCGAHFNGTPIMLHHWSGATDICADINPSNYIADWVYLAYTFDGTTEKLYADSELKFNRAITQRLIDAPPHVGGWSGWGDDFSGSLDEIAIYSTALSSTEVQAHYQNGLNGYSYCEQPPVDATPPTIVPTVNGTQGNNGWYTSDVTVSWDVSDPESGIASSVGCELTILTTDTAGDTLTCSATNGAGLSNSASVTVKIDKTPPTIVASATTDPNPAGWYKDDVTVHFTCNDALSGIPADACPLDQILSAEGAAVVSTAQSVTDAAGNTSNDSNMVTVSIDKTAPSITWDSSINNGNSFYFGFVPPAPTCTALDGLSGVDGSCVVSGYATTVGSQLLTATAKDNAGNQATENRNYTVLAWTLKGFYQPVDMNGVFNIARNGSTIPLKFEIFAGATELTDAAYIKSLTVGLTACYSDAPSDAIELTATGNTSLRYDPIAGQFIYNWKTPSAAGKCYRVTLTAIDGSTLVAYFKLK